MLKYLDSGKQLAVETFNRLMNRFGFYAKI